MPSFRHKTLAAALAALLGALGAHRWYLGRHFWWLSLLATAVMLPVAIAAPVWYQSPAFFALALLVAIGLVEALLLALMPDERFDARFNAGTAQRNHSGWPAVLLAVATLFLGGIGLMTVLALLNQTILGQIAR